MDHLPGNTLGRTTRHKVYLAFVFCGTFTRGVGFRDYSIAALLFPWNTKIEYLQGYVGKKEEKTLNIDSRACVRGY
jgi:hypothetical protein